MYDLCIQWIVLLYFNKISHFALLRLLSVIKENRFISFLIDCLFVPINRDTSIKVAHVDNTSDQLFIHHFVL